MIAYDSCYRLGMEKWRGLGQVGSAVASGEQN
jgi:hypothetical protein